MTPTHYLLTEYAAIILCCQKVHDPPILKLYMLNGNSEVFSFWISSIYNALVFSL
jgi:hypothetical protein